MDRKVLALHWRPDNFSQVIGHKAVISALTNSLSNNRVHHAYLFAGTRGVGKTTLARILAKNLNCHALHNGIACGICKSCTAVKDAGSVDIIEIDAASNTKVEDMRSLLDKVVYMPVYSKYKIYLIDEVHMLSNHSFNALLKTLEEPPEHVKFILATTEPDKLPATILSRCLQFHLSNLTQADITDYLAQVLTHEKVKYELNALKQIATLASGSMRDALSITDQAVAIGNNSITQGIVNSMLGIVGLTDIYNLVYLLVCQKKEELWTALDKITAKEIDVIYLLDEIITIFQHIAAIQHIPNYNSYPVEYLQIINKILANVSVEDTQLIYQIAILAKQDISLAPNHTAALYMTFIRMLEFQTLDNSCTDRDQANNREAQTSGQKFQHERDNRDEQLVDAIVDTKLDASKLPAGSKNISCDADIKPDTPPKVDVDDILCKWRNLIANLEVFGVTKVLIKQSSLLEHTKNLIRINMQDSAYKLWNDKHQDRVQVALNKYFKHDIRLEIVSQDNQHNITVTSLEKTEQDIQEQELLSAISQDANINYIKKKFNASIAGINL